MKFYVDGFLQSNLDVAKKVVKKDWDMVFLVDGPEGSGKSVLAMQCAYLCDPSFCIERVVFTPKDFREAVVNAKPYTAIVYDEAYTGLSSRATMSLINRTLIKMLAEIRQRNLFVIVVMPTFFDLDKYVALWRSRILLHVYTEEGFARGYFRFYNIDRKKDLYILGKKFYNYKVVKANFRGRFTNFYVVDESAYRKAKKDALTSRENKASDDALMKEVRDQIFIRLMELPESTKEKLTNRLMAQILGISEVWFYEKIKRYNSGELSL